MKCGSDRLLEAVGNSDVYREYERAFTHATGLPLSLRPVEAWSLVHHHRKNENGLCALIAQKGKACAACLRAQNELAEKARSHYAVVGCAYGMNEAAVPIRAGGQVVGFLQTGQIFTRPPTNAQFERTLKLLRDNGIEAEREELKHAYFETRCLPPKQLDSVLRLLEIFAAHLSLVANALLVREQHREPPVVACARRFIQENITSKLTLGQVATHVHASMFYICKLFKQATGINFTEYMSRVRVEKAKDLLLNPNLRVNEVAYGVGFQSLTHFNRTFRRITGHSPTAYRSKLPYCHAPGNLGSSSLTRKQCAPRPYVGICHGRSR